MMNIRIQFDRIIFSVLIYFFLSKQCFAQQESNNILKYKASVGGMKFSDWYLVNGTYSFLWKREDEIYLSLYYFNGENIRQGFDFGIGYNFSTFKKQSRFDLFLTYGINVFYDWKRFKDQSTLFWRCGPYFFLGFEPVINFSKRFSLSNEFKLGYGYLWSTVDNEVYHNRLYVYSEEGQYGFYSVVLKLNYKF
jgi:hypothetical protein